MKHFNVLILLTSALVLAGCGTTVSSSIQSTTKQTNNTQPTHESQKPISQSLKDLMSLGTAQKCTWTSTVDGNTMSGTVLIKDKKFKQTGTISTPGEGSVESNTISDGTYLYIWTNLAQNTGLKMKLDAAQTQQPTGEKSAQKFDINQKMDMSCTPATVSDADLAVPTNITFTDFSETMKNLQKIDIKALQQQYGGGQ